MARRRAGGVLAADGNIYGIPYQATQVLRFDPRTQQATLVGAELPGGSKWRGGVLGADGNIYGIPSDATQVLSVAVAKAAAPVAVVKEHVPGEKVLEANQTSSAYIKPSPLPNVHGHRTVHLISNSITSTLSGHVC